jgi:hypothetical protein
MAAQSEKRDRSPLAFIAAFAAVWTLVVAWVGATTPSGPWEGRFLAIAPLAVVGAVICALGYLSLIKRRAIRNHQSSLKKILEERRRETRAGKREP